MRGVDVDNSRSFQKLDMSLAKQSLESLHEYVVRRNGRVEIVKAGSPGTTVLVSKAELESLEQAIEILSKVEGAMAMRDEVSRLVANSLGSEPVAPALKAMPAMISPVNSAPIS
jgi:hypothetical protein